MSSAPSIPDSSALPSLEEVAAFTPTQILELVAAKLALQQQMDALKQQLDWFKRQIFGQKSEKRLVDLSGHQMSLGESLDVPQTSQAHEAPVRTVAAHRRTMKPNASEGEAVPFFDETRVPMEVVELANPGLEGLSPDQYQIIGTKESYRLAQRPGSYVVLKYVRPVVKRLDTEEITTPELPAGVIDGSRADVSFIAGLLVDKFAYHLPLFRQHQRLLDAGFRVSRPWLTQLVHQAAELLEPVYEAQLASIRASRVKAMDETPIKAGQAGGGKMKQGYFWPIYGEADEVCFPFFESRRAAHVSEALGLTVAEGAVLLTDGYAAYSRYAEATGLTHAQCWAHTRRGFFEAQTVEPEAAAEALDQIGVIYAVEARIREQALQGEKKRDYRLAHAKPLVERFFEWVAKKLEGQGLLPSSPFTAALAYARERRGGLQVFLADPDVPIDTNHLERALRAIPMGRKSWLFCWTEVGAKYVGIVQSLIVTCRLHGIDPYDYLVDVLQRVADHPAAQVADLTPRFWKQHFAGQPLRSDVHPQAPESGHRPGSPMIDGGYAPARP
jgi:transposase